MMDLYAGLAIMAIATFTVLTLTVWLTRTITKREATGTGVVVALLILLYFKYIWNQTLIAKFLPVSNLVVVSNWFPLIAAFLSGITWTHGYGSRLRRVLFGGTLIALSGWLIVRPCLVRRLPATTSGTSTASACRRHASPALRPRPPRF